MKVPWGNFLYGSTKTREKVSYKSRDERGERMDLPLVPGHDPQVTGGGDVVMSPQFQFHLVGVLRYRAMHGDKDPGHLPTDLGGI